MTAQPNIAAVAVSIGDATRAAILAALLGGTPLTAGELAHRARISPQTASTHLAKLVHGGLLSVASSGRHRFYRLASPNVANALETLATLAPPAVTRSLREGDEKRALRFARTCYDHLAGVLGVSVTQWMLDQEVLTVDDAIYRVTNAGNAWFAQWNIDLHTLRQQRRHFATPCLDWSERQPHLAGALGAALTATLLERRWITRVPDCRAVRISQEGYTGLQHMFGTEFMRGLPQR